MTDSTLPALQLKRGEDRRLRAGHLWVFSNEIDVAKTPLTAFTPGDAVQVLDGSGKPLGTGYVNPSTLIAAPPASCTSAGLGGTLSAMA